QVQARVTGRGRGDVEVLVVTVEDGVGGRLQELPHLVRPEVAPLELHRRLLDDGGGAGDDRRGRTSAGVAAQGAAGQRALQDRPGGEQDVGRGRPLAETDEAVGAGGEVGLAAGPLDVVVRPVLPDGAHVEGAVDARGRRVA